MFGEGVYGWKERDRFMTQRHDHCRALFGVTVFIRDGLGKLGLQAGGKRRAHGLLNQPSEDLGGEMLVDHPATPGASRQRPLLFGELGEALQVGGPQGMQPVLPS